MSANGDRGLLAARRNSSAIRATASSDTSNPGRFDASAVGKYLFAIGTQLSLFYLGFSALDWAVAKLPFKIPLAANFFLFYAMALKSRVMNPLCNNRPKPKTLETSDSPKRKMPTWTPPGPVFPIVWLLIIGPLRALTSSMVYATTGSYATPAIFALLLHLSIGDVWNTINNVERRYGVAVVGVLCVWLSKAFAAYSYYKVNPLAGKLLSIALVWLTIASALVTRTWQLNPDPETGKPEPLYPVTGKVNTKIEWFEGK